MVNRAAAALIERNDHGRAAGAQKLHGLAVHLLEHD
jgi:hypothetical protein